MVPETSHPGDKTPNLSILSNVNLLIPLREMDFSADGRKTARSIPHKMPQRILGLQWHDFVSNKEERVKTFFISWDNSEVACLSLRSCSSSPGKSGSSDNRWCSGSPSSSWRRHCGHPRNTWMQQISINTEKCSRTDVIDAVDYGHTTGAMLQHEQVWLMKIKN